METFVFGGDTQDLKDVKIYLLFVHYVQVAKAGLAAYDEYDYTVGLIGKDTHSFFERECGGSKSWWDASFLNLFGHVVVKWW